MSVTPITDYLSIAAWPTVENIAALRALGVRLIISMTNREPPPELAAPPFQLLHPVSYTHLDVYKRQGLTI